MPFSSPWLYRFRRSLLAVLSTSFSLLLILLSQLRDRAYMVLLISLGSGLIAHDFRPGAAWGVGMVVFGGLSLILREGEKPE
jgi:hypothetical protein